MEGVGEGAWDVGRVGDQEVVLGDWHGDAADVSFWKASVPMRSRETWPVIATRGTECICASSRGHEIGGAGAGGGQQTPTLSVSCTYPVAAWPSACSCRTRTCRMRVDSSSGPYTGRMAPQGCRTRSRHRVLRASAPLTELRCNFPGSVG